MVKKLSCVSFGSLKRFPHTFTTDQVQFIVTPKRQRQEKKWKIQEDKTRQKGKLLFARADRSFG